jgi:hypothetical protein
MLAAFIYIRSLLNMLPRCSCAINRLNATRKNPPCAHFVSYFDPLLCAASLQTMGAKT